MEVEVYIGLSVSKLKDPQIEPCLHRYQRKKINLTENLNGNYFNTEAVSFGPYDTDIVVNSCFLSLSGFKGDYSDIVYYPILNSIFIPEGGIRQFPVRLLCIKKEMMMKLIGDKIDGKI